MMHGMISLQMVTYFERIVGMPMPTTLGHEWHMMMKLPIMRERLFVTLRVVMEKEQDLCTKSLAAAGV
jgi:hypothetical protein